MFDEEDELEISDTMSIGSDTVYSDVVESSRALVGLGKVCNRRFPAFLSFT